MTKEREVLWTPSQERYANSTMAKFEHYLHNEFNLTFSNYNEMWNWSITELEVFWNAISQFFDLRFFEPPQMVLGKKDMPGAEWFPGAKVNYADQVLSHSDRLSCCDRSFHSGKLVLWSLIYYWLHLLQARFSKQFQ